VGITVSATRDNDFMALALAQAQLAAEHDEVPIGAVLVKDDQVIASAYNQTITQCDPSAHAEIVALRAGAQALNNHRLLDTTLYVTLEPCAMCAGAIIQARLKRVVFAAHDPKAGAVESVFNILQNEKLNHRVDYTAGVLAKESVELLQDFFKQRR
tara:strand:+ start:10065 stop:10532 length:468 start_codon:yes stop_codon:yes gene_type:complete